jgi:hypothetical protein
MVFARPPRLTTPAGHLATAAITQVAAAVGTTFWRARQRIAHAIRRALGAVAMLARDASATIEAIAASVADAAAILPCSRSAGNRRAGCSAFTQVVIANPTILAVAAGELAAAAIADFAAAILTAGRIAGRGRAAGDGHALIVGTDLVGRAHATVQASTTAITHRAAVFFFSRSTGQLDAPCPARAQMVLTGPASLAVAAGHLAAASVTEFTATVDASRRIAGKRRADPTRNALVVRTYLVGRTTLAIERISALVADNAAVLSFATSTRDRHAGGATLTDVPVADLPIRAIATFERTTAAIADGATVATSADLAAGKRARIAVQAGCAHAVHTGLAVGAGSAVDGATAVVANRTAILHAQSGAGGLDRPYTPIA